MFDDDRNVTGVIGVATDISERRRLEAEILRVSETEQQRIGQELHDSLGQTLTGIRFLCSGLVRRLEENERPEAELAGQIAQLASDSLTQTRSMARRLCPLGMDASGLMMALERMVDDSRRLLGVRTRFDCTGPVPVSDGATATHLFHIAQEAMNNAVRHSGARQVTVRLQTDDSGVTLAVEDDGRGFPAKPRPGAGMGMRLMRHRTAEVGGELTVTARRGGGTRVACRVPIRRVGGG